MKLVFLDIDGVVATMDSLELLFENYWGRKPNLKLKKDLEDWSEMSKWVAHDMYQWPFDRRAIDLLMHLRRETDCLFVLSSTWRHGYGTIDNLVEAMSSRGLYIPFIGATGFYREGRGMEIFKYMHQIGTGENKPSRYANPERVEWTPIESFIAIDDDSYDILPHFGELYVEDRLILTGFNEGFSTQSLFDKAVQKLNEPLEENFFERLDKYINP